MQARRPSLGAAAAAFRDKLNALLNATITQQHLSFFTLPGRSEPTVSLTFRQDGEPVPARLQTKFGLMGLYIGQLCSLRPVDEEGSDLVTLTYRYALHNGTDSDSGQIIRWEYERRPRKPRGQDQEPQWCRRHLQGPLTLPLGDETIPLDQMHLPTGYVPLEDVIRYCIVDLGVKPINSDWDGILVESYKDFRQTVLNFPRP